MDLGIAGRCALVTAASKGLGLASARALAADFADHHPSAAMRRVAGELVARVS